MRNLANVIQIMNTLGKEEQELLVEFKQNSMENKGLAVKCSRKLFEQLSSVEQMKVLYFLSDKQSVEDVKTFGITEKVVIAQYLILEDCKEETSFVDLEEKSSEEGEEAFSEDDFEEAELDID